MSDIVDSLSSMYSLSLKRDALKEQAATSKLADPKETLASLTRSFNDIMGDFFSTDSSDTSESDLSYFLKTYEQNNAKKATNDEAANFAYLIRVAQSKISLSNLF